MEYPIDPLVTALDEALDDPNVGLSTSAGGLEIALECTPRQVADGRQQEVAERRAYQLFTFSPTLGLYRQICSPSRPKGPRRAQFREFWHQMLSGRKVLPEHSNKELIVAVDRFPVKVIRDFWETNQQHIEDVQMIMLLAKVVWTSNFLIRHENAEPIPVMTSNTDDELWVEFEPSPEQAAQGHSRERFCVSLAQGLSHFTFPLFRGSRTYAKFEELRAVLRSGRKIRPSHSRRELLLAMRFQWGTVSQASTWTARGLTNHSERDEIEELSRLITNVVLIASFERLYGRRVGAEIWDVNRIVPADVRFLVTGPLSEFD